MYKLMKMITVVNSYWVIDSFPGLFWELYISSFYQDTITKLVQLLPYPWSEETEAVQTTARVPDQGVCRLQTIHYSRSHLALAVYRVPVLSASQLWHFHHNPVSKVFSHHLTDGKTEARIGEVTRVVGLSRSRTQRTGSRVQLSK